jgi:hypothetical protein
VDQQRNLVKVLEELAWKGVSGGSQVPGSVAAVAGWQ